MGAVFDRHDEVKAVRGQSAQDQIEVAERVGPYAHACCTAGKARSEGGAVGVNRADCGGGRRRACRELREQLTADLLKALVVDDAALRQHACAAAIHGDADLDADVRRRRTERSVDLRVGEKPGDQVGPNIQ